MKNLKELIGESYGYSVSSRDFETDKKTIKTMVNQTIYATSTQESRPILTGINLKIEKDRTIKFYLYYSQLYIF